MQDDSHIPSDADQAEDMLSELQDVLGYTPDSDFAAALQADMEALQDPGRHLNGPFVQGYLDWITGRGPAIENPDALLVASGVPVGAIRHSMTAYIIRDFFISRVGFAVPTARFIDALRPFGTFVEVGAGRGYLSKLLRDAGIDAIATDINPQHHEAMPYHEHVKDAPEDFEVLDLPVATMSTREAIAAHPDRNVLCAWPSLNSNWLAEETVDLAPGRVIAVIGEGYGGCTGEEGLFDLVEEGAFALDRGASDPSAFWPFPGIHDQLRIFRKL